MQTNTHAAKREGRIGSDGEEPRAPCGIRILRDDKVDVTSGPRRRRIRNAKVEHIVSPNLGTLEAGGRVEQGVPALGS